MCAERQRPVRAGALAGVRARAGVRAGARTCGPASGRASARGFTLPEAVIAIVVIGIGLAGLMLAFSTVARSGADPLLRRQMSAVASELLEEALHKPYAPAANGAGSNACARDAFNDVDDYNGYSSSALCSIDGTPLAELAGYSVSVSVTPATLGGAAPAKRISVTVSHGGESLTVVSWRADYAS